jgi:hypothetical protein
VKTALKGENFQDAEDIKKNVIFGLIAFPLEAFADYFQTLSKRFSTHIQDDGDCFE